MANDFSLDPHCIALWCFESGALTTDSKGTNTLTNSGADEDTTNYWEGSCAASFVHANGDFMYIEEADFDAGFPLAIGDYDKRMSMAFILKYNSVSGGALQYFVMNYNASSDTSRFMVLEYDDELIISHGYNNSGDWEDFATGLTLVSGHIYYIGIAHDGGTGKHVLVRVYDATAAAAYTYEHDWTNETYIGATESRFYIGGYVVDPNPSMDAVIDELVLFNDLKIEDEFDAIRAGTYEYDASTTGTADFYVPLLELIGTGLTGTGGTASFEVPKPQVTATAYYTIGTASAKVPLPKITATGGDTTVANIPLVQVEAYGLTGTVGTAVLTVPLPDVIAESASASITVPLPQVIAMGLTGTIGTLSAEVPLVEIDASGLVETVGTASITVPLVQVYGEGSKDTYGTALVNIPLVRVSASAYVGTIGTASITVPIPDIEALGYAETMGTASITVPLVSVIASATEAVILVQVDGTSESLTGYAVALNLKTRGLTEYDNYPFNSFAYFNGQYLGASSNGIYVLGADNDDGTAIDSKIQTGVSDEGTALRKCVEDAFLGLSAGGVMTAKVVTDGMISYDGSPITQRDDTLITERVKFGKGIRSRYLGLEVENSGGCDFTLESAELVIVPLTRKL
jgi:hypothetical protein